MKMRKLSGLAGALLSLGVVTLLSAGFCFAQSGNAGAAIPSASSAASSARVDRAHPQTPQSESIASRMAAGVTFSSLGIGGQFAVRTIPRGNVRVGFNYFSLSHTFNDNGITYGGKVNLRTFQGTFDYFVVGPLHISGGGLFYNGNKVTANLSVPSGQTFTLGGVAYESAAAGGGMQPIGGAGTLTFNKAAPLILVGVGNPIGRRHFQFWNFEIGVAYQGAPRAAFNLTGWACLPPNNSGNFCVNAATDPNVQANIATQQGKINKDVSWFRWYPVISTGLYFRF
jgi:hypothetical protein